MISNPINSFKNPVPEAFSNAFKKPETSHQKPGLVPEKLERTSPQRQLLRFSANPPSDFRQPATLHQSSSSELTKPRSLADGSIDDPIFLKPNQPESFESDVYFLPQSKHFEFAVDDIYGVTLTANAEQDAKLTYTLIGDYPRQLAIPRYIADGLVSLGEPLDHPKLLIPGYRYRLELTAYDDDFDYKVKGNVVMKRFDAAQAAKGMTPPKQSSRSFSINPFDGIPIGVGSEYKDQALELHNGGGCYTVYPCEGQERVKVSIDLEDRLFAKYGHIFFSTNTRTDHPVYTNHLIPINPLPSVAQEEREVRASTMYPADPSAWDGTLSANSTTVREWYNQFELRAGTPQVICVTAPWADNAQPSPDEQTRFNFKIRSITGNNQCDLQKAYGWGGLSPVTPPSGKLLRIGLIATGSVIGTAAVLGIILYCLKSREARNRHHAQHQHPHHHHGHHHGSISQTPGATTPSGSNPPEPIQEQEIELGVLDNNNPRATIIRSDLHHTDQPPETATV